MQPIRITYHGLEQSEALDELIHKQAAQLEEVSDRIQSLRVFVDAPHNHHRTGNGYQVRVELHLPGNDVVVRGDGGEAGDGDVYAAVRRAFDAAWRQLHDARTRHSGKQRAHKASRPSIRTTR